MDRLVALRGRPDRIQCDNGSEFISKVMDKWACENGVTVDFSRPGKPMDNGKVERSQKTDLEEFYSTVDLDAEDLEDQLFEWQHYYNWHRPHGSLNGKSPMDRFFELIHDTPLRDEVEAWYGPSRERIQEQNYRIELALRRLEGLKRCL